MSRNNKRQSNSEQLLSARAEKHIESENLFDERKSSTNIETTPMVSINNNNRN